MFPRFYALRLVILTSLCRIMFAENETHWRAMILSVIADSSSTHGKLIVEVANTGYEPGPFQVQIFDCPPFVTHSGGHLNSKPKTIHAQRVQGFKFRVQFGSRGRARLVGRTWSTMSVLNSHREVIAMRQILLSPSDTCICYLNCECTCAKDSLRCHQLTREDSAAAGIDNRMLDEINSEYGAGALFQSAAAHPLMMVIIFFLFLLLLGFCKGLIGLCCRYCACGCGCECCKQNWIGKAGLGYFYNQPRKLVTYYEKQYSNIAVVYVDGLPVDPITRKPTVERLSRGQLLAYNTIIFATCPCVCCLWLVHKCCTSQDDDEHAKRKRRRQEQGRGRKNYAEIPRRYSSDDLIENVAFVMENSGSKPVAGSARDNNQPLTPVPGLEDDDEEIVHYSRPLSKSTSSEQDQQPQQPQRYPNGFEQEHRQYGLSFFMNGDRLGSGSGGSFSIAAGRRDSNVSVTNVREDRSTEFMYRRTSAGQQEYAERLSRATASRQPNDTTTSNLATKYGSWHRQPSDWSLRASRDALGNGNDNQEHSKKQWFHS